MRERTAIGRELVYPGKKQRHRKTYKQEHEDKREAPIRYPERRRNIVDDLEQHPGDNGVGGSHPIDVPAF